ncbi:MAG: DnaT-like ssDNA-binding protein, partial [Betaproteobacteria bacterium]
LLRRGLDAIKQLPCLAGYALPLQSPIVIPQGLINAQIWAAYYIWLGQVNKSQPASANDPANVATSGVKRKKVDVIEIEYLDSAVKSGVSLGDMPNVAAELIGMGCASLTVKPMAVPYAGWV